MCVEGSLYGMLLCLSRRRRVCGVCRLHVCVCFGVKDETYIALLQVVFVFVFSWSHHNPPKKQRNTHHLIFFSVTHKTPPSYKKAKI